MKLVFAAAVLITTTGAASAAPTPLYDAFLKYCVATNGEFGAVNKLATSEHLVREGAGVLRGTIEALRWVGKDMEVMVGPMHRLATSEDGKTVVRPLKPPGAKAETCSIRLYTDRDESGAAIAQWAAVPALDRPDALEFGDDINVVYRFRGDPRISVGYSDEASAVRAGGFWSVHYCKKGNRSDVDITHFFMPAD